MASFLLNPSIATLHFHSKSQTPPLNYHKITPKPLFTSCSCTLHPNLLKIKKIASTITPKGTNGVIFFSTRVSKISPFVAALAANPTFVSGMVAWAAAQSTKVVLNFFVYKKWDLKIMCSSGGMPSSHSALCTALTASVGICNGVADSLFAVCLGFSLIVMYDAIGVRRHAGMQAQVLNMIVEDLFQGHPISQRKLKELLGHTPLQVVAGALLGIIVACFCCKGRLVVT